MSCNVLIIGYVISVITCLSMLLSLKKCAREDVNLEQLIWITFMSICPIVNSTIVASITVGSLLYAVGFVMETCFQNTNH